MKSTNNHPLVSVIIPAYNQGPMLAHAIESALAQTYPHVEIIVVNDGSPSLITSETVQAYAGHILYVERENGGVAAARNTGIQAATGKMIALLDQDDVWLPHKLTTQVNTFRAHPNVALVHSSYYLIDNTGCRKDQVHLREGEYSPLPQLLLDVPISSCTTLFPRQVLDEVGLLDAALSGSDDWDLWLRLAARGYSFYCVGEPLAEYRVHSANSSLNTEMMISSGLSVLDKFYSLPNLPVEALNWRNRAYGMRYAWAAALLYGSGEQEKAKNYLLCAAQYYPKGIATIRFLQSLIYARAKGERPGKEAAQAAVRFVVWTLKRCRLPPNVTRKLHMHVSLVLAIHSGAGGRTGGLVRTLLREPRLVIDPEFIASVRRAFLRAVKQIKKEVVGKPHS